MREPSWLASPNELFKRLQPQLPPGWKSWLIKHGSKHLLLRGGAYFPSLWFWAGLRLLWALEYDRSGAMPVPGLLVRELPDFPSSFWEFFLLKARLHVKGETLQLTVLWEAQGNLRGSGWWDTMGTLKQQINEWKSHLESGSCCSRPCRVDQMNSVKPFTYFWPSKLCIKIK